MQPHAAERRHVEHQLTFARPIFLVMALLDLLVIHAGLPSRVALVFIGAYLTLAVALVLVEVLLRASNVRMPLLVDLLLLFAFLVITPSVEALWYVLLFVAFAAGIRWGMARVVMLCGGVTLALLLNAALREPVRWSELATWLELALGTFAAGVGIGFLGARHRRYAAEQEFLARLSGLLQVEHGLAESIRVTVQEILKAFRCESGVLAFHDRELNRIFVWKTRADETARITPESLPPEKADAYLLDAPDISICWNSMEGEGEGFGWNRHDGKRVGELPRLPGPAKEALDARSLMAVTLEISGRPDGRMLLLNGERGFSSQDLQWLERMMRHLGPPLQNVFLLRHMRARTIESERNRISHDLHDGILQTMLSVEIQLDVMRRKLPHMADQVAMQLGGLQQTIRNESTELRRMVNDLRPLHVESADLTELMRGFGERFRSENSMKLELLTETVTVQVSDRICRELFQIYKEALHNIKKHSRASHVVVKLWQDEGKVCLVVDDNGQGFSFAGRFTSDELDRLRLGPISIKERTRSVGGVLTVESNPGHGARLTVEVPLN